MKKAFTLAEVLKQYAFTLAEVLITLGIIGVVAAMTIPTLVNSYQEKQYVTGLQKFNSALQQAVLLWKNDIDCTDDAYTCLTAQNLSDNTIANFDQIAKFMRISQSTSADPNTVDWLPDNILDYYGNTATSNYGNVSHFGLSSGAFLLNDGTTFSMDVDTNGFAILADVNGKKPPNRIGKDIFFLTIGKIKGKDIYYFTQWSNNATGLCTMEASATSCDPNNVDPTVGTGASPTAYVILNNKLPDFKKLSQSVAGFKP